MFPPKKKPRLQCHSHDTIPNPSIPHEITLDILSRLPSTSLIRFSSVCKQWKNSIFNDAQLLSSFFLRSQKKPHLIFELIYPMSQVRDSDCRFYCLNNDGNRFHKVVTIRTSYKRELIGCCNGLVCYFVEDYGIFEVCNPTRREILGLYSPIESVSRLDIKYDGFGFDKVSKEYKIICIVNDDKCMVFTLGTNLWRETASTAPDGYDTLDDTFEDSEALFCYEANAIYWYAPFRNEILSFDLHHEIFLVIHIPAELKSMDLNIRFLVYNGLPCIAEFSTQLRLFSSEARLHMLKKEEWIKVSFGIPFPLPHTFRVLSLNYQTVLYWLDEQRKHFRIHNLQTGEDKTVECPRFLEVTGYNLISLEESFLSLQTFGQERARRGVLDFYPPLALILQHRPRLDGPLIFFCSISRDPEPCSTSDGLCLTL